MARVQALKKEIKVRELLTKEITTNIAKGNCSGSKITNNDKGHGTFENTKIIN